MRSIQRTYQALDAPMGNLATYRAMPTNEIHSIDPFLFLNHHGPQAYGPSNRGLPFGPHPHRGFETLTYILQGDITHRDSRSGESIIRAGGIQWMTAGSGLIHAEVSSEAFKEKGGVVEIIQLWLNLPARLKMTSPNYIGLQRDEIPHLSLDGGKVTVQLISGDWGDTPGPVSSLTDLCMTGLYFEPGGVLTTRVPSSRSILFYVANGVVRVNGETAGAHTLVHFNNDGEELRVEAGEAAMVVFGHGEPYNEPVVAQGPFVMNTQAEIMQAMRDYQTGKMGVWTES